MANGKEHPKVQPVQPEQPAQPEQTLRKALALLAPNLEPEGKSAEQLAEEIRLHCSVTNDAASGLFVLDRQSYELLYLNKAMRDDFAAHDIPDPTGMKCYQAMCGNSAPCEKCSVRTGLLNGEVAEMYHTRLGKPYTMTARAITWQGRAAVVVGACKDAGLRGLKGNLVIAMQHAKMLYWEYDPLNSIAYCSPMVQEWFGTPEVILNYPAAYLEYGFVAEEDVPAYRDACRQIQSGVEYTEFDARVRTLQQGRQWMRIRMTAVRDPNGRTVKAVCTAERIAEYKDLEERFITILRQNQIASWRYDMARHAIVLNQNSNYPFTRNARGEVLDVPESQIREGLCHPDDVGVFRRMYRRLQQGERQVEEQFRFRSRATRAFRWEKCVYTVLVDDRGTPTYALGSAIDINDQIEAQKQYRASVEYRKHTQTENLVISGHCSVTQDLILEMTDNSGQNILEKTGSSSRHAFFNYFESLLCDEGRKPEFKSLFSNSGMHQCFEQGFHDSLMSCEVCLDGKNRKWLALHVSRVKSPDTNELEGFFTVTDMTQTHVQQQLLNTVLEYDYDYVASINFAADTIVLYQKNGVETSENGYRSGVYYAYSLFVRRALAYLVEPEDAALFRERMAPGYVREQLADASISEFICHIHTPDGELRTKRVRFAAYDKVGDTVSFSRTDVTEMVKQEEEKQNQLQRALDDELRSKRIIENVVNNDYDYVMVVDIATDHYQLYTASQDGSMVTTPSSGRYAQVIRNYATQYIVPEDQMIAVEQMEIPYLQAQLADKRIFSTQARMWGPNGQLQYKRAQFSYLDEAHTQLLITRVDITELMLDQEKKREKLTKTLALAEQAAQAKTDFLSRMSHDLRTPMNAIIGLSALTIDDALNPDAVRDNMGKMRSAGNFMLGLINDILDMTKIESGAVALIMGPYSYREFVVDMRTMFQAQCEEKGITFLMPEPTQNPVARADKIRVNQIFFNIFSNAVKYTPSGGCIRYEVKNLVFEGNCASGDCVISDNGVGMSEEFQRHMFEPFTQESNRVTPELQGTGLGLSITKQLVELMGGSIRIDSVQGRGTAVTIHLKFEILARDAALPLPCADPARPGAEALAGKNLLLVEDHPMNAQIARRLLEKQNAHVIYAENGRIAVEKFTAASDGFFDAILMDIRMPEMSGDEATRAIRALTRPGAKTVPIIAMTANAYPADIQACLDAGMNAHLVKPVDPQKLYETLAEQLKMAAR